METLKLPSFTGEIVVNVYISQSENCCKSAIFYRCTNIMAQIETIEKVSSKKMKMLLLLLGVNSHYIGPILA